MSISPKNFYLCHASVLNFPLVEDRPCKRRFTTKDIKRGRNQVLQLPECDTRLGASELGFVCKFGAMAEICIYFLVLRRL